MKKVKTYVGQRPQQCFPGKTGWNFLPEGFSGNRYATVTVKWTQYSEVGGRFAPTPCRKTATQAVEDCLKWAKEAQVNGQFAVCVRDGEEKAWRIFTL